MTSTFTPGGPAGALRGVVRPRPTHRDLEAFALAHVPGMTKAKARRLARCAISEADPYGSILGRLAESRMMRGADPTGNTAASRVDVERRRRAA